MGIRVRLCSDWCLRKADILSDYPQMAVSHIVRTQHFYFAKRDTTLACFGPFVTILKLLFVLFCALLFNTLPDLEHVLVCGGDDFGALAQILTDLVGGGADILFVF